MSDQAGRAELRAATEIRADLNTTDQHGMGHSAWPPAALRLIGDVESLLHLQAAEATRRELVKDLVETGVPDDIASILIDYGRVHGRLIRAEHERDEARAQLAVKTHAVAQAIRATYNDAETGEQANEIVRAAIGSALAARPSSPDTTEATGRPVAAWIWDTAKDTQKRTPDEVVDTRPDTENSDKETRHA